MKKCLVLFSALCMVFALSAPAFAVDFTNVEISRDSMALLVQQAERYAYQDMENANEEMQDKILAAREIIIFNESWSADDAVVYAVDADTLEIKYELPKFHEIFPADWELPAEDVQMVSTKTIRKHSFGNVSAYLDTPSNVTITDVFVTFTGMDPGIGENYGFYTMPDNIPGTSYNMGYTNMDTGKSVAHATYLDWATGLTLYSVTPNVEYGVRVSTYSTKGWAEFSGDHIEL